MIASALSDRDRLGFIDLEPLELLPREVMHRSGSVILEKLVALEDGGCLPSACACGGRFASRKREGKTIRTLLGAIRTIRTVQRCTGCGAWRVPADETLDVVGTGYSAGLRRSISKLGSEVCFERGRELLFDLAGVRLPAKEVERVSESVGAEVLRGEETRAQLLAAGASEDGNESPAILYITADGTGVPVLRRETAGRRGKGADGVSRSREAKLGAVFTQTTVDDEGNPVRDPASTTYAGKIESAEEFGERLYAEARRRGLERAGQTVVIGDGAPWVWNLADLHFPQAVQIVDFYHVAEHLGNLAQLLYGGRETEKKAWFRRMRKKLKKGQVGEIVLTLEALKLRGRKKEEVAREVGYFKKNEQRMKYDRFRRRRLFIGSGVVEAGCKSLIGKRLKQSGMHWSLRGANAIIALRCCLESGRFEDYWESRKAA